MSPWVLPGVPFGSLSSRNVWFYLNETTLFEELPFLFSICFLLDFWSPWGSLGDMWVNAQKLPFYRGKNEKIRFVTSKSSILLGEK